MIAKIITGTNVSGLLHYLTAKKFTVLTSNKLFPDADSIYVTNAFKEIQNLNPRCKNNLMHIVLSFPEKENLTAEKMKTITEDFLNEFGASENQWLSIMHFNTPHFHQHAVINRVKANGKLLSDSFSHLKAKRICRTLEIKYDLNKISNFKSENSNINKNDLEELISIALHKCNSLEEFIELMKKKNYKVIVGRGITFINIKNGTKIKGSAISRENSLSNIKKRINIPQPTPKLIKPLECEQDDIKNIISLTTSISEIYDSLNTSDNEEFESDPIKKKKRKFKKRI
jgi:hypothetical protein